jgi:hypothetical protein
LALELDDRTSFRDIAGGISDAETWSDIVQKWCAVQEQEHELASEMENPEMFGRYQINENEMLRLMLHKLGSSETLRVLQRFLSFADRLSPEAYVPIIRVGRITQTRERYLWHKSSEQLNGCSMHVCVCVCVDLAMFVVRYIVSIRVCWMQSTCTSGRNEPQHCRNRYRVSRMQRCCSMCRSIRLCTCM